MTRPPRGWSLLGLLLVLALGLAPLPPQPQHCITYKEKTMQRWQSLCQDGSRGIHRWNPVLEQWESTITPPPEHPPREKSRQ